MPRPRRQRARLAAAAAAGEVLDLHPDTASREDAEAILGEAVMRAWGAEHELLADDLVSVLRGRDLPTKVTLHPRGVRVHRARIRGRIDLDFVTSEGPLVLVDCILDEGLSAYCAYLPYLELRRCRISHPTWTPLEVSGARLADDLRLAGSVLTAPHGASATVALVGAHLGDLDCRGTTLVNDTGSALNAERSQVGGGVALTDGFAARGAGEDGAVRLLDARITGQLNASGAELVNETGPALHADGCEASGDIFLTDGFMARGAGEDGAIRLVGARINGQLSARGATLINGTGPALDAESSEVREGMFLTKGFIARGAGEHGAVRLPGARITDQLNASGAAMVNETGPALHADGCVISGGLVLTAGFTARGAGDRGAVRLLGVQIGGQLDATSAILFSSTSSALNLRHARIDGTLHLTGDFTAHGGGRATVIDLTNAHLRELRVNASVTHRETPQRRWNLNGCTYTGLPVPNDREWWIGLLRHATPEYAAQPFQQLAATHRAAGHDADVREILIAPRDAQIRRGSLRGRERAWARFTGVVLGYGWKPWRALYGLAIVFAVSVALAIGLGQLGALAHPPQAAKTGIPAMPSRPCSIVERIGVGLDLGTPLLGSATNPRGRCPIVTDPAEGPARAATTTLMITTWALQATAWGLAALFIAGFTSAVRKPGT